VAAVCWTGFSNKIDRKPGNSCCDCRIEADLPLQISRKHAKLVKKRWAAFCHMKSGTPAQQAVSSPDTHAGPMTNIGAIRA
jgi:hypothetical protein